MADNRKTYRIAAILGLIATVLALSAVAVEYAANRTINWRVGAGGLFVAAISLNAWARFRQEPGGRS